MHLIFQHLCFESKTLVLLLPALKTQPELKRQNSDLYRVLQSGYNLFSLHLIKSYLNLQAKLNCQLFCSVFVMVEREFIFSSPSSIMTCLPLSVLPNMEPLVICGYCTFEMWLVQIKMCCKWELISHSKS